MLAGDSGVLERPIEERERLVKAQREALREDLRAGLDQSNTGKFVTATAG